MIRSGTSHGPDPSGRAATADRRSGETGRAGGDVPVVAGGTEWIRRAVEAYCAGDVPAAIDHADRAAERAPRSLLARQLRTYLRSRDADPGAGSVYDESEGFTRFIRGGANVALYAALGRALGGVYRTRRPGQVLDVGPGDGRAVLQALGAVDDDALPVIDLVEPATGLLAAAANGLERIGVVHREHPLDIVEFLRGAGRAHRWELAQATFSLQSLPGDVRAIVLAELADRCDRLIIVEFDVPTRREVFDSEWFACCVDRMEQGVADYPAATGDRDLVTQQFLLPMMLGFFHPEQRTNHEQPLSRWIDQLRIAGFSLADEPRLLHDYWWAPAYLIEAVPHPEVLP